MVNSKRNKHQIHLRNVARKRDGVWVATCLELGLVVTSPTSETIKDDMARAVQLYLEGLAECIQQGHGHRLVPVKGYWFKRIFFDVRMLHKKMVSSPRVRSKDIDMWRGSQFVPC